MVILHFENSSTVSSTTAHKLQTKVALNNYKYLVGKKAATTTKIPKQKPAIIWISRVLNGVKAWYGCTFAAIYRDYCRTMYPIALNITEHSVWHHDWKHGNKNATNLRIYSTLFNRPIIQQFNKLKKQKTKKRNNVMLMYLANSCIRAPPNWIVYLPKRIKWIRSPNCSLLSARNEHTK